MTYIGRSEFILAWLRKHPCADICNLEFVAAYQAATGVPAYRVENQLGRDLSRLYHVGKLQRVRVPLGALSPRSNGLPCWLYSYMLPRHDAVP